MQVWPCSSRSTPVRVGSFIIQVMIFVQHRLQHLIGRRGHFDEDRFAFGAAPVHAVQHQAVQVNVQIGR